MELAIIFFIFYLVGVIWTYYILKDVMVDGATAFCSLFSWISLFFLAIGTLASKHASHLSNKKKNTFTIVPIEGDNRYAMITAIRDGKTYTKKLLVFTDEEMKLTYDLQDKIDKENK